MPDVVCEAMEFSSKAPSPGKLAKPTVLQVGPDVPMVTIIINRYFRLSKKVVFHHKHLLFLCCTVKFSHTGVGQFIQICQNYLSHPYLVQL